MEDDVNSTGPGHDLSHSLSYCTQDKNAIHESLFGRMRSSGGCGSDLRHTKRLNVFLWRKFTPRLPYALINKFRSLGLTAPLDISSHRSRVVLGYPSSDHRNDMLLVFDTPLTRTPACCERRMESYVGSWRWRCRQTCRDEIKH